MPYTRNISSICLRVFARNGGHQPSLNILTNLKEKHHVKLVKIRVIDKCNFFSDYIPS